MDNKMNGNRPLFTKTIQGRQHFLKRKPQPFSNYLNLGNSGLEILAKLSALLAILGIVLGGFISFGYLSRIDYLSIFPDAVSSPEGFLAILFVFWGVISLVFVTFACTDIFLYAIKRHDFLSIIFEKKFTNTKRLKPAQVLVLVGIISIAFYVSLGIFYRVKLQSINYGLIFLLFVLCLSFFFLIYDEDLRGFNKNECKKYKEKYSGNLISSCNQCVLSILKVLLLLTTPYLLSFLILLFSLVIPSLLFNEFIVWVGNKESAFIYPIIGVWIVFFLAVIINAYIATLDYRKGKSKPELIFAIPLISTFFMLVLIPILIPTSSTLVLKFPRFVETPINSQWYLLHNNFQKTDGSQEINGINASDLKEIKLKFIPQDDETECKKTDNNAKLRSNALCGYMAWNLGQTKIFCPPSADNREKGKLSDQCLVINGNLLQPLPKAYIGANNVSAKDNGSINNMNQK